MYSPPNSVKNVEKGALQHCSEFVPSFFKFSEKNFRSYILGEPRFCPARKPAKILQVAAFSPLRCDLEVVWYVIADRHVKSTHEHTCALQIGRSNRFWVVEVRRVAFLVVRPAGNLLSS